MGCNQSTTAVEGGKNDSILRTFSATYEVQEHLSMPSYPLANTTPRHAFQSIFEDPVHASYYISISPKSNITITRHVVGYSSVVRTILAHYKGRTVILKQLEAVDSMQWMKSGREIFIEQFKVNVALRHPHLVPFRGMYYKDNNSNTISLVYDYMSKGSLLKLLQSTQMNWEESKLKIAIAIASAMAYIHSNGFMHRRIRADKVYLDESGDVKLSTFGVGLNDADALLAMSYFDTQVYIAPEVKMGEMYTTKADIHAFGVLLTVLDEQRQFVQKYENAKESFLPPVLNESCPREIREIVALCMHNDPDDRPEAYDVVMALENIASIWEK